MVSQRKEMIRHLWIYPPTRCLRYRIVDQVTVRTRAGSQTHLALLASASFFLLLVQREPLSCFIILVISFSERLIKGHLPTDAVTRTYKTDLADHGLATCLLFLANLLSFLPRSRIF